jgi:hypothetical protein
MSYSSQMASSRPHATLSLSSSSARAAVGSKSDLPATAMKRIES